MSNVRVPGSAAPNLSGADTEEDKKKSAAEAKKTQDIETLVNYLLVATKKIPPCPRPVKEHGYLERKENDPGTGLLIREDLIKAQKELAEMKGNPAIGELYRKLHELQGEYVDGVLRGENPDLKQFKDAQAKQIEACKDLLNKLEEQVKDHKDNKEISAHIAKQKQLLEGLPNKIEATRDNLIEKLKRQKQRYVEERNDKELSGRADLEDHMFSVYLKKRDTKLEKDIKENKYNDVGDDAIAGARSVVTLKDENGNELKDEKGDPIPITDKKRKGYQEAKDIIREEIERAEREPPHESWFLPFGKESKDVNYLIHRYRGENGRWYLEAEMLRENKLEKPEAFKEMIESLFKFQKFANCETDIVTLSYPGTAVLDKNIDRRAKEILITIDILMKKGEAHPPTRELVLDRNAKDVLFKCKNKKKVQEIEAALIKLEEQGKQDRAKIAAAAKPKLTDTSKLQTEIKKANDESKAVLDAKTNTLHDKLAALEKKGNHHHFAAASLKEIFDEGRVQPDEQKPLALTLPEKARIEGLVKAEENTLKNLFSALEQAQEKLQEHILEVNKVYDHNPNDPALDGLMEQLKALDQNQKEIACRLKERCDGLTLMDANVDKASAALDRVTIEEEKLTGLMQARQADDKTVDDKSITAQTELIAKSQQEVGGLIKDEIDIFKAELSRKIGDFSSRIRDNQQTTALTAKVDEIGGKVELAKSEKESAMQRFNKP